MPKLRDPSQSLNQTRHRARYTLSLPRLDDCRRTQRQQPNERTNFQTCGTTIGKSQQVIVKAIFLVPHTIRSGAVHGRGNVIKLLGKLEDHILVTGIVGSKFDGDLRHILAEQGHPGCPVCLLQVAAGGKRCTAIEDADVIEAEKASFEYVLAEPVFTIHPPGKIQSQLVERCF